jgi:hypothetical protein
MDDPFSEPALARKLVIQVQGIAVSGQLGERPDIRVGEDARLRGPDFVLREFVQEAGQRSLLTGGRIEAGVEQRMQPVPQRETDNGSPMNGEGIEQLE